MNRRVFTGLASSFMISCLTNRWPNFFCHAADSGLSEQQIKKKFAEAFPDADISFRFFDISECKVQTIPHQKIFIPSPDVTGRFSGLLLDGVFALKYTKIQDFIEDWKNFMSKVAGEGKSMHICWNNEHKIGTGWLKIVHDGIF